MKTYAKRNVPVSELRRFLEPGPIVLVSSAWKDETNIMTMGWHMPVEFQPSLVACVISNANHSFGLIRKSRECVINIPTVELADTVVRIGNCSGRDVDKFEEFGLTRMTASTVGAPLVGECYASFECRLSDSSLVNKYNLFIFEVVKGHAAASPKFPRTIHYRGNGLFMLAGPTVARYRRLFKPEML